MLDRIATAELQLEPTPSPGALRTRRWREKKAEENGTAGNPAPTEQNTNKFNGHSDDDAENSATAHRRLRLRDAIGIIDRQTALAPPAILSI
jgi:hypothetical protein